MVTVVDVDVSGLVVVKLVEDVVGGVVVETVVSVEVVVDSGVVVERVVAVVEDVV